MRLSILLSLLPVLALPAQQSPGPAKPRTLHAQARLVVVDVVVTDAGHNPIRNLKQQDFSVLEDHKPQTITSFEEHKALSAADAARLPATPPLPPGTFSNFTPAPPNTALNILLIDTLNTPVNSQVVVRNQVLKYLQNARPGTNTAIFGLSNKLVMLQGFTTNPALLKAVALKLSGRPSPLLDNPMNNSVPMTAGEVNSANATTLGADLPILQLQTFLDVQTSVEDTLRANYTLDGLNLLAHYLSSIPGRKNLIWFSAGFPLSVAPDATNPTADRFIGMADYAQEYRETVKLLAAGQVAVYPIDARGLMLGNGDVVRDMALADTHFTMMEMAADTGGRAFINTNGLAEAVDQAIDDGSSYYTISYRPGDLDESGRFRRTEVRLAEKGYLLEYRHGYYEDDPDPTKQSGPTADKPDPNRSFAFRAMEHGVPASSEILFKARVLPAASPADGEHRALTPDYLRRYAVDYAVLPNDIAYTTTPDGLRHFNIEIVTIAYRSDGVAVSRLSNPLKGTLTPAQFTRIQQTGFPWHQEIDIPIKGDYSLRLHDIAANRVGATELSIASVRNLPPTSRTAPPRLDLD